MSDGSARLTFRDPETFAPAGDVWVTAAGIPVDQLNELECVDGAVYANVWTTDQIVRIDPATGEVTAIIDASALMSPQERAAAGAEVLNGIAWNPASEELPGHRQALAEAVRGPVRPVRRFLSGLALLLVLGCSSHGIGAKPAVSLLGSGPLILPGFLKVDGLDVGGLSALARVEGDVYRALVDGQKETPSRVLELRLSVTERGVEPPAGLKPADIPRSFLRLNGFTGDTLDTEGMVVWPSGDFLISSETEPGIRSFEPDGRAIRILPVPEIFKLVKEGPTGIKPNEGFEALTAAADGKTVWTTTETALKQDVAEAERSRSNPVRLLRYDFRNGSFEPAAQYVYEIEPVPETGTGFWVRGVVELLALPEGGLLALEREFVTGIGNRVQLFRVEIGDATDVSGLSALAGQQYRPVRKTLLYDFADAGFRPDNLEGMAFGPDLPKGDRTLLLVSDDNFQPLLQATQIVALRLPR